MKYFFISISLFLFIFPDQVFALTGQPGFYLDRWLPKTIAGMKLESFKKEDIRFRADTGAGRA